MSLQSISYMSSARSFGFPAESCFSSELAEVVDDSGGEFALDALILSNFSWT